MKISKSFVIDAEIMKSFETSKKFYLGLGYIEKNSIMPRLLVFKKRIDGVNRSSSEAKSYVVRVEVSLNPVGNLQLYSTSLITVRCTYTVNILGEEITSEDKRIFESEIKQLKNKLVGNIFNKKSIFQTKELITGEKSNTEETNNVEKSSNAILPNRISTGFKDLDNLLLGGLPEKYAVILSSPSNDEREIIIKNFLKTGVDSGEVTFYLTLDSENGKKLAQDYSDTFSLFLTNPRADDALTSLPNVFKVNGVGTLSQIDIALTKSLRSLNLSLKGPRRICIDIISDVLLQHQAVITRKWISGLISELKSNGFTIIAVINPLMHPPDQVQAILGLFDCEIKVYEKDTADGIENVLRVRKLYNQEYLKTEIVIKKESLES